MLTGVSGASSEARRPGWIRDVELPRDLGELRGSLSGNVRLPLRLFWTGPAPQAVEWDLSRESRRARLYEIVLREGTLDDVRSLVNGPELVRVWDRLWLPPHVRTAWQVLIDAARHAA
jgi:hypothetical protein